MSILCFLCLFVSCPSEPQPVTASRLHCYLWAGTHSSPPSVQERQNRLTQGSSPNLHRYTLKILTHQQQKNCSNSVFLLDSDPCLCTVEIHYLNFFLRSISVIKVRPVVQTVLSMMKLELQCRESATCWWTSSPVQTPLTHTGWDSVSCHSRDVLMSSVLTPCPTSVSPVSRTLRTVVPTLYWTTSVRVDQEEPQWEQVRSWTLIDKCDFIQRTKKRDMLTFDPSRVSITVFFFPQTPWASVWLVSVWASAARLSWTHFPIILWGIWPSRMKRDQIHRPLFQVRKVKAGGLLQPQWPVWRCSNWSRLSSQLLRFLSPSHLDPTPAEASHPEPADQACSLTFDLHTIKPCISEIHSICAHWTVFLLLSLQ